jgi:hypothetical protein
MVIEHGSKDDIDQIVELLRTSLGEELMPKSQEFWNWKHIENPFGASPVIVWKEGGEIIGVRAFMRWRWRLGEKTYPSVRAVDTATHPAHQGKGIFKKLTLALVDECTSSNDKFVFNTPNDKSRPGYLKMGWEIAGQLPIVASFRRPHKIAFNLLSKPADSKAFASDVDRILDHPTLSVLLEKSLIGSICTDVDVRYLKWRYKDVPVAAYQACGVEQNGSLKGAAIGRLKQSRIGLELRIVDLFLSDESYRLALREEIVSLARKYSADFITLSGTIPRTMSGCLPNAVKMNRGPIVTIRPLAQKDMHQLVGFTGWSPSLGDLELF